MAINKLSSVNLDNVQQKKQIKYLNKDYNQFKTSLVDFIKFYYPDDYQDFSDASPGSIFLDMAAYVGDVLSYYTDQTFKENLLAFAEERENIISIAQGVGYTPRTTSPAFCMATISMLAPATADGDLDLTYLLRVNAGSSFTSGTQGGVDFTSTNIVDFSDATTRTVKPFSLDNLTGLPTSFIVSKKVKLISARDKTVTFTVGSPTKYLKLDLVDPNVIEIKTITDQEGNTWYQVDNLAQDYLYQDVLVTATTSATPIYSIKPLKVNRRFMVRITRDMKTQLVFGSGTGDLDDVYENPDYKSVYNANYLQNMTNVPLDTINFSNSNSFGLAPGNTVLSVTYTVGGGTNANVGAGVINKVNNIDIINETRTLTTAENATLQTAKSSISITNDEPASGGADVPDLEEMRNSAMGYINSQARIVTTLDYQNRVLSMPAKYGTVSKAFVVRDDHINKIQEFTQQQVASELTLEPCDDVKYVEDNPINTNINLYVMGYDADKRLAVLNCTVKDNIKEFLNNYRILTDRINILDAFTVNISVNYSIVVYNGYQLHDVLARASDKVREFFDIDNWQINQPIVISDLWLEIAKVEGVQSITNVQIGNKYNLSNGSDYSIYAYDIDANTKEGVVYPSADPCVFELRYPQDDIIGTATQ